MDDIDAAGGVIGLNIDGDVVPSGGRGEWRSRTPLRPNPPHAASRSTPRPRSGASYGRAPGARGSHGARLLWHEGSHVDLCTI